MAQVDHCHAPLMLQPVVLVTAVVTATVTDGLKQPGWGETAATLPDRLITQRSQVQVLPPLPTDVGNQRLPRGGPRQHREFPGPALT